MDLPSQERDICGKRYRIFMLPMGRWFEFEALVMRLIGPALAEILSKSDGRLARLGDLQISATGLGNALYEWCSKADSKDHEAVVKMLSSVTRVDDNPLGDNGYLVHWPSNMRALVPFLAFGLQVQLADFFVGAGSAIGVRLDALSQSHSTLRDAG